MPLSSARGAWQIHKLPEASLRSKASPTQALSAARSQPEWFYQSGIAEHPSLILCRPPMEWFGGSEQPGDGERTHSRIRRCLTQARTC